MGGGGYTPRSWDLSRYSWHPWVMDFGQCILYWDGQTWYRFFMYHGWYSSMIQTWGVIWYDAYMLSICITHFGQQTWFTHDNSWVCNSLKLFITKQVIHHCVHVCERCGFKVRFVYELYLLWKYVVHCLITGRRKNKYSMHVQLFLVNLK